MNDIAKLKRLKQLEAECISLLPDTAKFGTEGLSIIQDGIRCLEKRLKESL